MSEGVVVVCGIPGAGKSHFAEKLVELNRSGSKGKRCELLSFDDFEMPRDEWDETTFKTYRATAITKIRDMIEASVNDGESIRRLVVDDLMYLSSMRHEVYRLTRDLMIPMAVVWINTSLETALERNSKRCTEAVIDPDTIQRIHDSFEAPNPTSICDRVSDIITEEEERARGIGSCAERINASIWDRLSGRKAELIENRGKEEAVMVSKRESGASGPSQAHDLDQNLRNIVSSTMKNCAPEAKRALSEHLKHAKASALETFREGDNKGNVSAALLVFEEALTPIFETTAEGEALKRKIETMSEM